VTGWREGAEVAAHLGVDRVTSENLLTRMKVWPTSPACPPTRSGNPPGWWLLALNAAS